MSQKVVLPVDVPKFDDRHYLERNPSVTSKIESGAVDSALGHYLHHGIDANSYSLIRREALTLAGSVERFLVSQSGFCLLIGWLGDEGYDQPRYRLLGGEFSVEFPAELTYRHARPDVEAHIKRGAYDYGFVAFGRAPSHSLLKQSLLFQATAMAGSLQAKIVPEVVSDKRLLDTLLEMVATCQAHAGSENVLYSFLSNAAGNATIELFQTHVSACVSSHYVERFGVRPVKTSFVSVLFGSTEPMKMQPVLFRSANIDFGEWIYVCNSPEDATTVLRYARQISALYDVMITVIVMGDNAGFGAANNVAIEQAASDRIFIINPDVYPLPVHAAALQDVLSNWNLADTLWGGLLFYDEQTLMHSGMYVDRDPFVRRNSLNRIGPASSPAAHCNLLRVEHYDKGVPFEESDWQTPKEVTAITGAVMAFQRPLFEKLNGFSTRYIYGHYEDADLSLRWKEEIGPVSVHPFLRLIHLEGQGSKYRGEQYRGASIANRHFFTAKYGDRFDNSVLKSSRTFESHDRKSGSS
jgi:GT2 family glycosyltransferase